MVENSEMEFYHQYFNVHNAELLPHIKRKVFVFPLTESELNLSPF